MLLFLGLDCENITKAISYRSNELHYTDSDLEVRAFRYDSVSTANPFPSFDHADPWSTFWDQGQLLLSTDRS